MPSLERVVIKGPVRWVNIDGAPKLRRVKPDWCMKLAHFEVHGAPLLESFNIDGCLLLKEVLGLVPERIEKLRISEQILAIQAKSQVDLKMRKQMTFTEIDSVLAAINEGFKAAVRRKLIHSNEGREFFCAVAARVIRIFNFSVIELWNRWSRVYTEGYGRDLFIRAALPWLRKWQIFDNGYHGTHRSGGLSRRIFAHPGSDHHRAFVPKRNAQISCRYARNRKIPYQECGWPWR